MEKTKKMWITDAMRQATPIAARWAHYLMKVKKLSFADFEDDFLNILLTESKLYTEMKKNLVNHIGRHGLNAKGLSFLNEFEKIDLFSFHRYEAVLRKIRKSFAQTSREIAALRQKVNLHVKIEQKNIWLENIEDLRRDADDLEYLISKINEFLRKIRDLDAQAFEMLVKGEAPNLEIWKNQAVLNDRLFEENKQFLKQTLHHIETLIDSRCKLGVAEIRLLLYHKEGCRRQKLQKMVEDNIVTIFNQLDSENERYLVYPEICNFVAEIVPTVGYISPLMVSFIFDRGFVSSMSRDLLLKLKPIISRLNMTPLILTPLQKYYDETLIHIRNGVLTETDDYVLELMQAYHSAGLPDKVLKIWQRIKATT